MSKERERLDRSEQPHKTKVKAPGTSEYNTVGRATREPQSEKPRIDVIWTNDHNTTKEEMKYL